MLARSTLHRFALPLLIALVVGIIVFCLFHLEFFKIIELRSLDYRFHFRNHTGAWIRRTHLGHSTSGGHLLPIDERIIIIAVDEKTLHFPNQGVAALIPVPAT